MTPITAPPLSDIALDPVALARLHALDPEGRNGVVERVLKAYDGSLERMLGQLREELERCDAAVVSRIAHTLKSSSASVGALRMAATCDDVERRTRAGPAAAQRHDVAKLIDDGEAALKAVRAMLART